MWRDSLRLAVPSEGELHEPALRFLHACGIAVEGRRGRRYAVDLPDFPGVVVLFQRSADIPGKVEEGSADLGIAGLDRYLEARQEGGDAFLLLEDLGFGRCELAVAVPEAWVDVSSMADLADLSVEFRERGREFRVATKYPRLVGQFLVRKGITYFTLVPASGTLEAAPLMGYADIIADLMATGTTLRENRLKALEDGTILVSQACLLGNRRLLAREEKREKARALLEPMEAHLRASAYYTVTATFPEAPGEAVVGFLQGEAREMGVEGAWAEAPDGVGGSLTLLVPQRHLPGVVDRLRRLGGRAVAVHRPSYLFRPECQAFQRLLAEVAKGRDA